VSADTIPVREAHAFDVERLERYLATAVPEVGANLHIQRFAGRPRLLVRQFSGGQSNPTYLLTAGSEHYVLRRKPPGALLPSAHAVDREFRVIRALHETPVPVPRAMCYCGDETVIGTAFYVMEYVDGRIFWDHALPGLTPQQRGAVYDELSRVIAELHRLDPAAVGLQDFGKPGNYVARQIARWTKQYRAAELERIDAMECLIDWLPRNVPLVEPLGLTHGDFRLDNVIFDANELRIRAVLDWELATLGNPLADFAYSCIGWRLPERLEGLDLAALGIPSEQQYAQAYCRRTGRESISDFDFYVAFGMFRLAAILQGVAARALAGNASSAQAAEAGRRARPMAEAAWSQLSRIAR
jgi:aminoglycoside phosphotransferase (APT) family kinase protein